MTSLARIGFITAAMVVLIVSATVATTALKKGVLGFKSGPIYRDKSPLLFCCAVIFIYGFSVFSIVTIGLELVASGPLH